MDHPIVDDTVAVGSVVVRRYSVIGTNLVIIDAYEPYDHYHYGSHSSYTHMFGLTYGKVGTRRLPKELEDLPKMSDKRIEAVKAYHESEYARARACITEAYPECVADPRGFWCLGDYQYSVGEIQEP